MDSNPFVTFMTVQDPMRARLIRNLLEQEGIPAATPGLEHRALEGVFAGFVEIFIQVRQNDLERAKELVDAFESTSDGENADLPESAAGSAPEEPAEETPRRRVVAAFVAMCLPFGFGHLYAREHVSAVVIGLGIVAALGLELGLNQGAFLIAIPVLWVLDIVGGIAAVDRFNRGQRRSAGLQLATRLPWVIGAFALGWILSARR